MATTILKNYFSELIGALEDYAKVYIDDNIAISQINNAIKKIEE